MSTPQKGSREAAFSFFDNTTNAPLPGLAASAANRLPRWALVILVLLYVGHGLVHRDAWRGDDMLGIALARAAIEGLMSGDIAGVLLPQLQGHAWNYSGPLWAIIQGIFMLPVYAWSAWHDTPLAIQVLDDLARLPVAISLLVGFVAIWKSTDRFGRRREAQPIDPLGVGPRSQDFGKTLADCALLLTTATLGVIYPWHQAGVASVSLMLTGLMLWSLSTAPETPKRAGFQTGLIVTAAFMTHGIGLGFTFLVGLLIVFQSVGPYRLVAREFYLRCFGISALLIAAWMLVAIAMTSAGRVAGWWVDGLGHWAVMRWLTEPVTLLSIRSWANDSLWKWWPLWPIAAFGLWKARKTALLKAPHWAVPVIFLIVITMIGLIGPTHWKTHQLMPVAPLALIAAFGLLSLPRPIVNLIDWFAVVLFTALGIFIWLYWTALNFGFPEALATRVPILAPGVVGDATIYEVFIGVAVTAAWISLVLWRIRRGSPRLWRPVVLSAGGLTLVWALLMTLWIPAIDRLQGQTALARSLTSGWIRAAELKLERPAADIQRTLRQAVVRREFLNGSPQNACIRLSKDHMALDVMAVAITQLPIHNRQDCLWQLGLFNPSQIRAVDQAAKLHANGESISTGQTPQWKIVWQSSAGDDRRGRDRYVLLERID
jgi:hypothetical protein